MIKTTRLEPLKSKKKQFKVVFLEKANFPDYQKNMMQLLLENGDDFDFRNGRGRTPLLKLCEYTFDFSAVYPVILQNYNKTMLKICNEVQSLFPKVLASIIADYHGVTFYFSVRDWENNNALHILVDRFSSFAFNETTLDQILAEMGEEAISQENNAGESPLSLAVEHNRIDFVAYFLKKNLNVATIEKAFHEKPNLEVLADPNFEYFFEGNSPLFLRLVEEQRVIQHEIKSLLESWLVAHKQKLSEELS